MQIREGCEVHLGGRLFLQGFQQRPAYSTRNFSKDHAVSPEFNRHQTISRIFKNINTEPSSISAEPDQTDKLDRKPAIGF